MPKWNGGVIGPSNTPTTQAASGVWSLAEVEQYTGAGTWPVYVSNDPYFPYTTLLLHGDGTNGAQNNTFLDSSTNNFTITRNGNATQGTFSPFSQDEGKWSAYFDGNDYISIASPATSLRQWWNTDFTLECWIYPTTLSGTSYSQGGNLTPSLIGNFSINSDGNYWSFGPISDGTLRLYYYNGSSVFPATSSETVKINQWNHIALTNVAGTGFKYWVNGVGSNNIAVSGTPLSGSEFPFVVGWKSFSGGSAGFTGYVENLRIVKGTAVYTSNFTPPTFPLTAISGTSLLTCQSNRFKDNSTNNFTITKNGDVRVTPFSPFAPSADYSAATNGGSGYFDGNGDYLSVPQNSAYNFGTGAFTVEGWFYFWGPFGTVYNGLINLGNGAQGSGPYTGWGLITGNAGTDIRWYRYDGTETQYIGNFSFLVGTWYHIAACRNSSSNLAVFVNGTRVISTTSSLSYNNVNSDPLNIGYRNDGVSGVTHAKIYLSNLRIIKGNNIYDPIQTTISVPTSPLTAIANTSLLLNFTNAGILDNTGKNNLETVGNAQISTSVKKYGTGSLAFDGDDYLLIPPTQNLEFGSEDFTIEFWWYPTSTSRQALYHGSFGADWSIGIDYSSVYTNQKIGIWASSNGSAWDLINADTGGNGIGTTTVTQNAWNHIAYVRSGTTWRLFVNGNRDLNLTGISGSIVNRSTYQKGIGVWWNTTAMGEVSGFIDDLRITKGVARYTSNFTPPTSAFSNK